jgi:hypothetical protein
MAITSVFAKLSNRRKRDEGQVLENGLQEKEKNMEESTVIQESVGKNENEDTNLEIQVEKKVKLENGDPVSVKLVSLLYFVVFENMVNSFCVVY